MKQHSGVGRTFLCWLDRLAGKRHIHVYIFVAGVALSSAFAFLIYPAISETFDAELDPEFYGLLGRGIWKLGTLSYYPDIEPAIQRGPIYPVFIAFILAMTRGWYPYGVQAAQCLLFGLICLAVFSLSERYWNRRTAVLASLACCFNPVLIWLTSRIWSEVLVAFLLMLLIGLIFQLFQRPSVTKALLAGVVLGAMTLAKQTFLPFVFFIPLFLLFLAPSIRRRHCVLIGLVALVVVIPWSIRNWYLTGRIVVVHSKGGIQIQMGDKHLEELRSFPFLAFEPGPRMVGEMLSTAPQMPHSLRPQEREVLLDSFLMKKSFQRYWDDPGFFFRKLAMNAYMFWFSGASLGKSITITIIQLPIVALFVLWCVGLIRRKAFRTVHGVNLAFVWVYFGLHLPLFAIARYSSILIPVMTMYAASQCLAFFKDDGDKVGPGKSCGS